MKWVKFSAAEVSAQSTAARGAMTNCRFVSFTLSYLYDVMTVFLLF